MQQGFTDADVAQTIADLWGESTSGSVDSSLVRSELEQDGFSVPDDALLQSLERLEANGMISAAKYMDSEAVRLHGGMVITFADVTRLRQVS